MKQLKPASPVAGPAPDRPPDRLRTGPRTGPGPARSRTGHQKFNFFNILQGE